MKKLSKQQVERRAQLAADIARACLGMNVAIDEFNASVVALHAGLAPKVDAVNVAIDAANAFTEEVHDELESYYDEKSERWQEGEAGQAYADWRDEWDLVLDALELEEVVPFDQVEIDVGSFEDLAEEVSS